MYGSPPTWSSCACVIRNARTLALRSRRYVMSGTTRSIPNISSSGNIRPQSMTTMSSPYSKTNMFLPISPTPPRGMIRRGFEKSVIGWRARRSEERQLVGVAVTFVGDAQDDREARVAFAARAGSDRVGAHVAVASRAHRCDLAPGDGHCDG